MLAKFKQYSQSLPRSLAKPKIRQDKSLQHQLQFEWVDEIKQLRQVQHFRALQFSQQFGISFEQQLDQDLYDFDCEHAVIREKWSGDIVAYTRVKPFNGDTVLHSYSAKEFDIAPHLGEFSNIVEIGRTCVHPQFRSGKALSMLWLNLMPKLLWSLRAKHIIGCVSIRMLDNEARAYYTHQYVQRLPSNQLLNVASHQPFEPTRPTHHFVNDERVPKLFAAYLNMQARLSRQAFYDRDFNCLDYFVYLPVNEVAKTFVMKKMIQK